MKLFMIREVKNVKKRGNWNILYRNSLPLIHEETSLTWHALMSCVLLIEYVNSAVTDENEKCTHNKTRTRLVRVYTGDFPWVHRRN